MGRRRKGLMAAAAAVMAVALLASCGGSGSNPGGPSNTTGSSSAAGSSSSVEAPPSGGTSGGQHVSTPLEVSGGGSAQFRTHGGDNSIQNFGQEGGESELKAAGEALHGFLLARTNEEWPAACSYLSSAAAKQIEELGSRSGNGARKSCGEMLAALTAPLPTSARREVTVVDAVSLRQEGQRAFLIYRGENEAHSKVYAITMARQGGVWKVAGLGPFPLG